MNSSKVKSFYKINRLLPNLVNRSFHRTPALSQNVVHRLSSRGFVQVQGPEVSTFLQGLITNDMRHFEEDKKEALYALFLNNKGRVLYDSIIHKNDDNSFLIECDCDSLDDLKRYLKLFRLKKKIDIEDVSNNFNLWALIPHDKSNIITHERLTTKTGTKVHKDPRLPDLGCRVISPQGVTSEDFTSLLDGEVKVHNSEEKYRYLLYKLGVAEGVKNITPGKCFPLEVNCDYLHGVSFHKGCYIGQELTARVHYTGVVRKRLMPLQFNCVVDPPIPLDSIIVSEKNANLGKLKGLEKDFGLALVRINEALEAGVVTVGNYDGKVLKPNWWPIEAPKEKIPAKLTNEAKSSVKLN